MTAPDIVSVEFPGPAFRRFVVLLLFLASLSFLFTSPRAACDLDIVPDAAEYAFGAWSIAERGEYCIRLNGLDRPPRYTPWFSFMQAPFAALAGHPCGGIYLVLLCALAGIGGAFCAGRMIAGIPGGVFAGLAMLALPDFRFYGTRIMTDAPCAAAVVAACALYMAMRDGRITVDRSLAGAGLLAGFCIALRPLWGTVLIPFIPAALSGRLSRSLRRLFLLSAPAVAVILLTMLYQAMVFNDPLRSGYRYWCAVPCDYAGLLFGWRYLRGNMAIALGAGVPVLAGVVALWCLIVAMRGDRMAGMNPGMFRAALFFALSACIIPLTLHAFYFFNEARFFIPGTSVLIVICAAPAGAAGLFSRGKSILLWVLVAMVALGLADRHRTGVARVGRVKSMTDIVSLVPAGSVLVSGGNPLLWEFMLCAEETGRTFLPVSRNVEYASKLIVSRRVDRPEPCPADAFDHRCAGIVAGGGLEVYDDVALSASDPVAALLAGGRRVFLEATCIPEKDSEGVIGLVRRHGAIHVADGLYELVQADAANQ